MANTKITHETVVHGTVKITGNAAKVIRQTQYDRLLHNKPASLNKVLNILLCEAYNKRNNTNDTCE